MASKLKLLTAIQKSLEKVQKSVDDLKGSKKTPSQMDVSLTRVSTAISRVLEKIGNDAAKDTAKKTKTKTGKKPLNSYMLFTQEYRAEVENKLRKGDNDAKISVTDVARELGKMWRGPVGEDWKARNVKA